MTVSFTEAARRSTILILAPVLPTVLLSSAPAGRANKSIRTSRIRGRSIIITDSFTARAVARQAVAAPEWPANPGSRLGAVRRAAGYLYEFSVEFCRTLRFWR